MAASETNQTSSSSLWAKAEDAMLATLVGKWGRRWTDISKILLEKCGCVKTGRKTGRGDEFGCDLF